MHPVSRATTVAALCLGSIMLPACRSSSQSERTRALEERLERQDARIDARAERRRMRSEAEDRRYHNWFNRVMGRPGDL